MPYIGKSTDGFGIRERFTYVVSAGATSISGADANGRTLLFEDPEYVDVFLNGVRLKKDTDYNTSTANTIAGLAALAASDEVEVIVNDIFTLADMVSANNGGDFRGDLSIAKDSGVLSFGADKEITLTHSADAGLNLKHTATGDNNPIVLTLQTGETDMQADDVIGSLNFQAPDESTGTDAILVAAGIEAISEGDFSASSNATKLSFKTASSAAAAETMSLSSAGVLTVASNIVSSGTITGGGLLTTGGSIVIPDAGTIGSASDTNAIAISSAGVITISTNTDSSNSTTGAIVAHSAGFADDVNIGDTLNVTGAITGSSTVQGTTITATTAFVPDANDGASLGTTSLEFSDLFLADGAKIEFGNDQDANITHTSGAALTTNASFTSTSTLQGTTITATTAFVPDASDGAALGSATLEFSDLFLADGGEVKFGADQDVLLRHDHNSGLIIDRTNTSDNSPTSLTLQTAETDIQADDIIGKINFQAPDEATGTDAVLISAAIQARSEGDFSSSANATSIDFMTGASEAAATKMSLTSGGDLTINTDNSKISFGADADVTLTHVADVGLTITNTNTNDNLPIILQLKSEENEVVANEVIGSLEFAAGDSDGTDAATVAAGIHAIAEGTFSASANATKLVFTTGVSETAAASATAKMTLSSGGNLTAAGTITGGGLLTTGGNIVIPDAGNIGSASDTDAIAIASNGQVTLTQTLIGTALDISGDIDVDGTTNLDVVDIDGAVDMASTLQVDGAITSSAGATITTANNLEQLTLISTDTDANQGPVLRLRRDSANPADNDIVGYLIYSADNDAGQITDFAGIRCHIDDVTDGTEDGNLKFFSIVNGTEVSRMGLASSETVFNEDSVDVDFRVESNASANGFFLNGGTGNIGIGGDSDAAFRLSVNGDGSSHIGAIQFRNASSGGNTFTAGMLSATSSSALLNVVSNANLVIKTNDTERMRIDGSGYIYVATGGAEPSASQVGVSIKGAQGQNFWKSANSGTSGYDHLKFFNGNGAVGSIFTNGSATTYSTSSDYRLKENVTTSWDATTRLKQLKPSRFNFIADADTTVDGFLAHEVSSIVPEAIGGTKDATEELTNVVLNADGTVNKSDISQSDWTAGKSDGTYVSDTTWVASKTVPKYQSIDQSKLVPLLVKTIQELEARITALEDA